MQHSALNTEFKSACGYDYEKSGRSLFEKLKDRLPDARERAQRLNNNGKQNANPTRSEPHHINPYVGIVELLDAIDAFT